MRNIFFAFLSSVLIISFAGGANAQVKDKTFKDWTVYTTNLQGNKACYIATFPKSKTGNYKKRDEPYFLVTRIADKTYEVSTSSGYKYKKNSDVSVDIHGSKFNMFTKGELAWAADGTQDNKMINLMKKKNNMNVRGTSIKGTYSIDKYSLSGFTAAYKRMQKLCS